MHVPDGLVQDDHGRPPHDRRPSVTHHTRKALAWTLGLRSFNGSSSRFDDFDILAEHHACDEVRAAGSADG